MKLTLAIASLVLLAACGQPSNQALPTVMPTDANVAPATATQPATAASTEPPLVRSTLPPTWTVSPVPTDVPTATIDAAAQAQLVKPTLAVCGGFAADREHSMNTFTAGSPVQVFWTAVDTAARYRIALHDDNGTELFVDYALEPNYTFSADLFQRGKRYSWSVWPEDANNQQMCFDRGDEILPP
ncbi:MAG: hypothetical protein ABI690_13930 [Chloroflexota bacterium]